ncbi:NUDIX domain-containing protein [Aliikangiella coralliicola]|uniref:ADP-ribose pyrophosphatase n=1 Tax=Aliikangiella coralliicola TaxID=2592383 RepID=A0A545UEV8_9GAMM|nr:NUDIX hydrolase [Aliikangiella coralliicola]TQV87988.1 NUDIX hydrolase [Aliikangiella coralliicola]
MKKEIIKKSTICYDGFFKILKHAIQYKQFDGNNSPVHNREVLVRNATVAIILFDEKQQSVLLTEQFRIGPLENDDHPWLYEIPAGIVEPGEDKSIAIQRELLEETGYRCDAPEFVGEFYLSPGGTNETTSLYFAKIDLNHSGVFGATGENEDIKTHVVKLATALEMLNQKKLSAITGLALLWLKSQQS